MLKGLLRIRRYQQETPCALQEADVRSWLRFGEAYSALRDWRPIPAALLSHSVVQCSGTEEFLPTTTAIHLRSPPSGNKLPRQTTKYKEENVHCQIMFETSMWKLGQNWHFGPTLACKIQDLRVKLSYCPQLPPILKIYHKPCNNNHLRFLANSGGTGYHGAITRR
jgi:hypothetical protein